MLRTWLALGGLVSLATLACAQSEPAPRTAPPLIVIKADDLKRTQPAWDRFMEIIDRRDIKGSIGIICDSLEKATPEYLQWIKTVREGGRIEFWNHGYDHKMVRPPDKHYEQAEFNGPPYETQFDHLSRSQQLAQEKLGFAFETFGAPFNATDYNTVKALKALPDLKVWLYGNPATPAGKQVLTRIPEVNIENPTFSPNLEKFIAGYRRHPEAAYFVIQGHPPQWDDARFAEFERILDFLQGEQAVFVTPAELAQRLAP